MPSRKKKFEYLFAFLLLTTILSCSSFAQFEHRVIGARSAGLGGIVSSLIADPWSGTTNPASIAGLNASIASISVVPYRFELEELRSVAAAAVIPTQHFTAGVGIHRFGFDLYNETTASIITARRIFDNFSAGIGINFYYLNIQDYGNTVTIGINTGLQAEVFSGLTAAFAATNFNRPTVGETKTSLPQVFFLGLKYTPHPSINLYAEVQKDILYPAEYRLSVEYTFVDVLAFRVGMNDEPSIASGGFRLSQWGLSFEYALQWHFVLGQTHFVTLSSEIPFL